MRNSGILMHITSLPGKYGVGSMGKEAYAFVDFLKSAGVHQWQILPLNPTGFGDSPYQSCSTFAGNPYLIDLDMLFEDGLLTDEELETAKTDGDRVDYDWLYRNRPQILHSAYERFVPTEDYRKFCRENGSWLSDYSLFMALKNKMEGRSWCQWEEKLKNRDPETLWQMRRSLQDEIGYHSFVQYQFFSQWDALHGYARENGVKIIGDVPIYVPLDSCDVWADPELFQMDQDHNPTAVAGCPPDGFSEDGQLWGNPLYRWDEMKRDGYSWWIRRLSAAGRLYDTVRLDHFRGFEAYWAVPFGMPNAREGKWVKGPGKEFFRRVKESLPELNLIAEDLGYLTEDVLALRDETGYPGMKVLEFAFDDRSSDTYLPHTYTPNTVCYLGTHDNMTMRQWLETASESTVEYAVEYMALTEKEGLVWGAIRTAMASVSDLCIIQMQDYLELGAEGRMNFPGTLSGSNWTWRAREGFHSPELANRIRKLAELYGRA